MRHEIDAEKFGPRGAAMAHVVQSCVHCGLCLSACPTYQVLGEEMDSPRGRIYLMKNVLEGELPSGDAQPFLDRCLGCWACVPACPSGVAYGELLTHYRASLGDGRRRSWLDAATRKLLVETLPYPGRFRAALAAGRLGKAVQRFVPGACAACWTCCPPRCRQRRRCPTWSLPRADGGLASRCWPVACRASWRRDQHRDAPRVGGQRRRDGRAADPGLLRGHPDAHGRRGAGTPAGTA